MTNKNVLKGIGGLLVLFSLGLWCYAFWFMDITKPLADSPNAFWGAAKPIYESVYNIGLLQQQMLYVNTAGILFLSGIILIGVGILHDKLTKN